MARFADLLEGLGAQTRGDTAVSISDVVYDSRAVTKGALFVALRGARADGHDFVTDALARGAAALLLEEVRTDLPEQIPFARVDDTRTGLAAVSAAFHDHPSRGMRLIGVTGTNGKTSVVRMIEAILAGAGRTAGSIGTISARYAGHEEVASLTTPESRDLQATFARMRDAGVEVVALEVSSHSLALHRVHTLRFAVAVFTNLTQDHLDYHGTMEAYAETKARLFREPYLEGTAVLHAADAQCAAFADAARLAGNRVVTFARGAESTADIRTAREKISLSGSQFTICADGGEFPIELPLAGEFQLQNALAAGAATSALGVDWQQIQAGLATCPPVPGRFERVASSDPAVFVDYAHTPDALEAVLGQMRAQVSGKLICVFGCGGDRDRGKRAQMARAACRHSDYVVATQDNPRTEDPEQILADLAHGLSGPHEIVADRRDAIARAVALAALNDVVLIAGKGHENYQILGTQRVPFDDRSEALAALDARGAHA